MEAGVEHLGRATARGVDSMVIVVEPGQRSVDCAKRIIRMAHEIGLQKLCAVANKVSSPADEKFIRDALPELPLLGVIPVHEAFAEADRRGIAPIDILPEEVTATFCSILEKLKTEVSA
jgi:CO dehydrogenase maturation factor